MTLTVCHAESTRKKVRLVILCEFHHAAHCWQTEINRNRFFYYPCRTSIQPSCKRSLCQPTSLSRHLSFFFLGLLRMTIRVDSTRLCWCFCLELSQNQTCSILSQFYIFLTFTRKRNVEKVNRCLPSCDTIRWTN